MSATDELVVRLEALARECEFGNILHTASEMASLIRETIEHFDTVQEEIRELEHEVGSLQDQLDTSFD